MGVGPRPNFVDGMIASVNARGKREILVGKSNGLQHLVVITEGVITTRSNRMKFRLCNISFRTIFGEILEITLSWLGKLQKMDCDLKLCNFSTLLLCSAYLDMLCTGSFSQQMVYLR